jgi:membrane fusion protein (multidrug efflux system)
MDGVVSKRTVEPGTLLSAGNEIAVVTQTDPLRFQMDVPTTRFSDIKAGVTPISITVDAYPGEAVETVVSRVYPVADASTRTLRVEALLENSNGKYVPGMYAVGSLALGLRENVLCVPFDAVVRNGPERIVYRVEGDVARAMRVTLGIRDDAVVEVVDGLSEEDEIVLEGQHRLTDGVKVKRASSGAKGGGE